MSDFRFACPKCGQRIACDSSLRGTKTTCPNCQGELTVPAPAPRAAAGDYSSASRRDTKISGLAIASLVCSCFLSIGCLPGIICGHLARVRIRRNPALLGNGLATAGLIVSYAALTGTMIFLGYKFYKSTFTTIVIRREFEVAAVMAARGVDDVKIGDPESESDHKMQPGNSGSGVFFGRHWRGAAGGGRFSYVMKVLPYEPMILNCRYWGSDSGGRIFDILVNQRVIATQELNLTVPERFFDVEYKIPRSLTHGKHEVTVEFHGRPGLSAGGVFGCQMLKR